MRNIYWLAADGSMAFTFLSDQYIGTSREHAAELLAAGNVPADWKAVAFDAEEPPHHLPQEVWSWNGTAVVAHPDKARAWHKSRLRAERAPLLADQDVAFQRAMESGADTKAIVAEKKRLRDVTAAVDSLQTWEDMAAVTAAKAAA